MKRLPQCLGHADSLAARPGRRLEPRVREIMDVSWEVSVRFQIYFLGPHIKEAFLNRTFMGDT